MGLEGEKQVRAEPSGRQIGQENLSSAVVGVTRQNVRILAIVPASCGHWRWSLILAIY